MTPTLTIAVTLDKYTDYICCVFYVFARPCDCFIVPHTEATKRTRYIPYNSGTRALQKYFYHMNEIIGDPFLAQREALVVAKYVHRRRRGHPIPSTPINPKLQLISRHQSVHRHPAGKNRHPSQKMRRCAAPKLVLPLPRLAPHTRVRRRNRHA